MKRINEHLKTGLIKVEGLEKESDEIYFYCKDGFIIKMYHSQNCCENVFLESADSLDNNDDIYTNCDWEIMEEVSNNNREALDNDYSYTWTFYKITTNKGYDTLRWYGTSNGYYSEEVDFFVCDENYNNREYIYHSSIEHE